MMISLKIGFMHFPIIWRIMTLAIWFYLTTRLINKWRGSKSERILSLFLKFPIFLTMKLTILPLMEERRSLDGLMWRVWEAREKKKQYLPTLLSCQPARMFWSTHFPQSMWVSNISNSWISNTSSMLKRVGLKDHFSHEKSTKYKSTHLLYSLFPTISSTQ